MVEKALLLAVIAVTMMLGLMSLGNQMNRFYTKLECTMSGKVICIIDAPNKITG
jgi:Flp pilus assembly pilin Flp